MLCFVISLNDIAKMESMASKAKPEKQNILVKAIHMSVYKTKNTRRFLILLIIVAFSIYSGFAMSVNQNKIPVEAVEREWNRYVVYCRQEHISWSDLTFPEWLSIEASE